MIWFVAELILFTPNTYDNNKLLYVAYMLLCIAASDFAADWFAQRRKSAAKTAGKAVLYGLTAVFAVLCTLSAVLTLGREYVSDYQLYDSDHMAAAEWPTVRRKPTPA